MLRQLDKLAREQILEGLGRDDLDMHPAWTSPEDSGLVRNLLARAQVNLDKVGVPDLTAEDLLQNALAGFGKNGKPCLMIFVEAGRCSALNIFHKHPSAQAHPVALLGKWFCQKARTEAQTYTNRATTEIPITHPHENRMSFLTFLMWNLDRRTKLGEQVLAFLNGCNYYKAPKEFVSMYLKLGEHTWGSNDEMGRKYGVHFTTASRWSRHLWRTAKVRLPGLLVDELEDAHEKYLTGEFDNLLS